MPVPVSITDLSTTAASNSPAGSDSPTDGDNHIRALAAFIRQLYDGSLTLSNKTLASPVGTGQYSNALGSASAPSYSFTGDLNTGIYSSGADTVNIATGGTLRATVNSTGLGLGVTPLCKLHAKDAAAIMRLETTTARGGGNGYADFADPSGRKGYIGYGSADDTFSIMNEMNAGVRIGANSATALSITSAGIIQDANGLELGFKVIPPDTSLSDGASLTTAQRGKAVVGSYSSLTVPSGVFARGDCVSFYNDSASNVTLTQGASMTLRLAGTTTTGSRTVAARGLATIWFNGASEAVVSGAGVS